MELERLDISPKKIGQLNDAGIHTVENLYEYVPQKYYDFRTLTPVKEVRDGEICAVEGTVLETGSGKNLVSAKIRDAENGYIRVCWFGRRFLGFEAGDRVIVCGQIKIDEGYKTPTMYPICGGTEIERYQRIYPVYRKIRGMSEDYLEKTIDKALEVLWDDDYLDEKIRQGFCLISQKEAYLKIHRPENMEDVEAAQQRFIFDDLFVFNFQIHGLRAGKTAAPCLMKSRRSWETIEKNLPYRLTDDQKKALEGMYGILSGGRRLNALLQGDVGCGKTIVAIHLLALAAENGFQSCLIAPTEILARQHYEEIRKRMKGLPYKVGFLSGSMTAREKKNTAQLIASGMIDIVVGTHAVLQSSVHFQTLGMVVVDEQHLFGVEQRNRISDDNPAAHFVLMSATPIPRTLSMALYGESIQVFNIKTLPAGRRPVRTGKLADDRLVNGFMLREIRKGRQCYVVCLMIEKSDKEALANVDSAENVFAKLKKCFQKVPEVKVGLINGNMAKKDIEDEIDRFVKNEINILVSTTIVEVGVNVPNATVMVVKNAERFGLAQLHQLRGRVGRSEYQSFCILQPAIEDRESDILCKTTDGFEIAVKDLEFRGPGEYIGTRQSGGNKYVMLMLANPDLYRQISRLIDRIYKNKRLFKQYEFINDIQM